MKSQLSFEMQLSANSAYRRSPPCGRSDTCLPSPAPEGKFQLPSSAHWYSSPCSCTHVFSSIDLVVLVLVMIVLSYIFNGTVLCYCSRYSIYCLCSAEKVTNLSGRFSRQQPSFLAAGKIILEGRNTSRELPRVETLINQHSCLTVHMFFYFDSRNIHT